MGHTRKERSVQELLMLLACPRQANMHENQMGPKDGTWSEKRQGGFRRIIVQFATDESTLGAHKRANSVALFLLKR